MTLRYLDLRLGGKTLQEFGDFWLSYDNMTGVSICPENPLSIGHCF